MKATAATDPLRYKPKQAAAMLGLDVIYLYQLVRQGVFTAIRPGGKGPGKKLYLLPAEVRAYATGGRDAVARLRSAASVGGGRGKGKRAE